MEFMISRTSLYGADDRAPHERAYKKAYIRVDERTTDDPEKIPHEGGGRWYKSGRNHRVENGHIMRDYDDEAWFIEIKDLDDLIQFTKTLGGGTLGGTKEIVFGESYWNNRMIQIEIYDDYRE